MIRIARGTQERLHGNGVAERTERGGALGPHTGIVVGNGLHQSVNGLRVADLAQDPRGLGGRGATADLGNDALGTGWSQADEQVRRAIGHDRAVAAQQPYQELDQLILFLASLLLEECGDQGGLVLSQKLLVTSVHQGLADGP